MRGLVEQHFPKPRFWPVFLYLLENAHRFYSFNNYAYGWYLILVDVMIDRMIENPSLNPLVAPFSTNT